MGHINELPDDLLLKILSLIPTKEVVATSLLSKRWESLWTNVRRLEYDQEYHYDKRTGFSRFVDKSLLSYQSPILESLKFKFKSRYGYGDIGLWMRTAVNRHIRELTLECGDVLIKLPLRLFTCKTLMVLKLNGWIDLNIPLTASLPSLKTLHLVLLRKSNYESFSRLLSKCPVLTDLMVEQRKSNAMSMLNIAVPSLQRLSIRTVIDSDKELGYFNYDKDIPKVVINVPSLKYLTIDDRGNDFDVIENLSQVVEARIKANETSTKVFLRCISSSVKRLSISSLKSKDVYSTGSFFCQLEHLELYTDSANGWLKLLAHILESSINLRVLKLFNKHSNWRMHPLDRWDMSSSTVPECIVSSLEVLQWRGYLEREIDKEVMSYLLKHSLCLKTVMITPNRPDDVEEINQIAELFASFPIGSKTCKFGFNLDT
ncbi:hypothetical protein CARUB_v10027926mg [Capsella rubella]|uniref:F-box domain-containing protein n=1 Tax=Capsella rubella TaxID=81985 RepID=R0GK67_9BRAS|nr:hypothetical protein CARUB_v10027926mg [Capsella rubella]